MREEFLKNYFVELKQLVEYKLTKEGLIIGCQKCKENEQNLLDGAKGLLDTENTFQFALGLYIYAVEEYGKARLLKWHLEQKTIRYLYG